jgi:hypothetical protein
LWGNSPNLAERAGDQIEAVGRRDCLAPAARGGQARVRSANRMAEMSDAFVTVEP